jgi:ABC-type transport system substrate-binding protein
MRSRRTALAAAVLAAALGTTACGSGSAPDLATTDPGGVAVLGTDGATETAPPATSDPGTGGGASGDGGQGSWPSPEDCISYDPNTVTANYAAGVWSIRAATTELVRVFGGPDDPDGQHALNLAKRYTKVCFIGRGNGRDDATAYVFEYWRDPSGISAPLPDPDDVCSSYDPTNLVHDSMGASGWRVRDDDHVLQIFDTEQDAIGGKLVLGKYNRICTVASETPEGDPADITYA